MPKAQAPFIVPYICCKVNALTDSWAGRADPGRSGGSSRTTNHEFPYPKKISLDLDFLLFASNMLLFGFPFCKNKHQDGKFFSIYLHDKKWQFPGNKFLRHFGNYNMYCIRIFNYFPLCSSHIASKKSNMGIHDSKLPRSGLQTRRSSNPQVRRSLFSSLFRESTFYISRFLFVGSPALLHHFLPIGIAAFGLWFATLGGKYP